MQHEVGIKYQPPGTKDLYQVAVYNLRQKNVQQRVSVDPPLYAGVGSVRARGIELSANAALTKRLNMIAGYTYNKIEYRSNIDLGSVHLEKGLSPALSPRQMASLWLHYDLGRGIRGGLGERYVEHSDFYTDSAQVSKATRGHTASYALTDAFLSTELSQWSSAFKGINVKLNATNLFDKKYLTGCFSEQYCYFGDRRQVTATVDYSF